MDKNKGAIAIARRYSHEIQKMLETLDSDPFGDVSKLECDALRLALQKAQLCTNNILLSLGDV